MAPLNPTAIAYLPDGQEVILPSQPDFWDEGARVTVAKLNELLGTVGMWYAARPLYQGLGTSATTDSTGRASIALQTDIIDTADGHDPVSDNTGYAFPQTDNNVQGAVDYYLCIGYIPFASDDAATVYEAQITTRTSSGSLTGFHTGMQVPGGPGHAVTTMVVDVIQVFPTDQGYITLDAYVFGTLPATTSTGGKVPSLTVRWVGASWVWTPVQTPVSALHSWVDADEATAYATGSSSQPGGQKVPLNREINQNMAFHGAPPVARLALPAAQSAPSSTWTSVPFSSADFDTFGGYNSATNTRYTVQQSGLYLISGTVAWTEATAPSGYRASRLRVNGNNTQIYGGNTFAATTDTSGNTWATTVVELIQLSAGDYVELQFFHNQGSALSLDTSGDSYLIAIWQSL